MTLSVIGSVPAISTEVGYHLRQLVFLELATDGVIPAPSSSAGSYRQRGCGNQCFRHEVSALLILTGNQGIALFSSPFIAALPMAERLTALPPICGVARKFGSAAIMILRRLAGKNIEGRGGDAFLNSIRFRAPLLPRAALIRC
jgi:hypothetical protein